MPLANACAIYRSHQTNLFEQPLGSSGRCFQMFWTDGQTANPPTGRGTHRISDRRNHRRYRRLAHTERALRISTDNVNFDRGRVAHSRNRKIGKRALLGSATAKSNLPFQRRRNSPDNSTFDLLLDARGIDYAATINCCNHALHMNVVLLIESNVDDVGNVSVAEISIASHTASGPLVRHRPPVRFVANGF